MDDGIGANQQVVTVQAAKKSIITAFPHDLRELLPRLEIHLEVGIIEFVEQRLDIISRRWAAVTCLPDALFFSFRKHPAIPYDGPQDEIEQMKRSGAAVLISALAPAVYQRLGDYKPLLHLENAFVSFGPDRRAVIDDVHYSPDFNRYLAEQVAAEVLARLVDRPL